VRRRRRALGLFFQYEIESEKRKARGDEEQNIATSGRIEYSIPRKNKNINDKEKSETLEN